MAGFEYDIGVPVPSWPRAPKYPLDEAVIAHAERRVAKGMTRRAAILDAIGAIDPSPELEPDDPDKRIYPKLKARIPAGSQPC